MRAMMVMACLVLAGCAGPIRPPSIIGMIDSDPFDPIIGSATLDMSRSGPGRWFASANFHRVGMPIELLTGDATSDPQYGGGYLIDLRLIGPRTTLVCRLGQGVGHGMDGQCTDQTLYGYHVATY